MTLARSRSDVQYVFADFVCFWCSLVHYQMEEEEEEEEEKEDLRNVGGGQWEGLSSLC